MQPSSLTVAVYMDYQNIHLTGHGQYTPDGQARHLTLVHPLHFAAQVMSARRTLMGTGYQQAKLVRVVAFRGLPSNSRQATFYRRSQAQQSHWTRDRRVEVILRPLRYPEEWPAKPAQEKGIDVLLALRLVQAAQNHEADILILATHDTDLEPAVAMAESFGSVQIETAGWARCRRLRGGNGGRRHTPLDGLAFERCRDIKDYT